MSIAHSRDSRSGFWLALLCVLTMGLGVPAQAGQSGSRDIGKQTQAATDAPGTLDAATIAARIALVSARNDIPALERDLVLKQLRTAAARLDGADAARGAAHDYAAALQSAPATIAALNAESASSPSAAAQDTTDLDPVQTQLELASLQAEAVTLRTKQRDLQESLRNMSSRPEEARAELADLRSQLDQQQAAIPANASSLLMEAIRLREDATRQELSARIDKIEQELLSLPTRESIATARRGLTARNITWIDTSIAALNTRINAQRKRDAEEQAAQAHEFARRMVDQPAALRDYASKNAETRVSLESLSERLDQARRVQPELQTQQSEVAEARHNAEEILAIGRVSDESGRLLRDLQADLPTSDGLQTRIANRRDAIVDARVQQLQARQELRTLQPEEAAARRYLTDHAIVNSASNLALMKTLVERRHAALSDLDEAQGQLISVLSAANALDSELMQSTGQLRSLLDKRLLWLPSAEPLGTAWLRQLATGVAWLVSPANWSVVPSALVSSVRARGLAALGLLAAIVALFLARRRMVTSLETLAAPVGRREDSFQVTLLACAATLLLALTWPLAIGSAGWMLRAAASRGDFANAVGHGLLAVATVMIMLGVFVDMCRQHGVFIAHFGWPVQGTRRLARALRLLFLAMAPAALVTAMTDTSAEPELVNGIGRLSFIIGSLALALFFYRVFRVHRGVLSNDLDRGSLITRTRRAWSTALVAIPLLLAALAAVGYYVTARELQSRLFTSGWITLAVVIAFSVAMRGVLVSGRHTAWRQADERRARARAEAVEKADGGDGSDALNLQNREPEIDAVAVSQQTRALLRAISGVVLAVLLWGIWSTLVPALNVFNDIALWSHMVSVGGGDKVAVVTLGDLLLSLLILILTVIAARNLPGFLEITLLQRLRIDSGTRYAITTMGRYLIFGVGLLMAVNHIGADWSQLKWLVAALGVGLGFGLQEIVANFISGIIILFERPVRVGDLVSIGPTTGTVSRIKIRAITITDFDNFEVMVPNKAFITETVQNWSLTNQVTRLLIDIRVAYGSDVEQTQKVILGVATANPNVLTVPAPSAYFLRFGKHALEFELRVYVGTIDERLSTQHALHVAMIGALKDAGIEILFPQRDVRVRHPDAGTAEP